MMKDLGGLFFDSLQAAGPALSPSPGLYKPKSGHDVTVPYFSQVHWIWIKKYTFM